jgi:ribosomal protein S18 acetylase RimI-like enzyme
MTTTQRAGLTALPLTQKGLLHVRPASRRDLLLVCRIECACFGWERMLFGLWQRIGKRGVSTWVAEVDGRQVGYVISYARALNSRPVWYVGGIGVLRSHRCYGVATQLMRTVFSEHPSVWLHVRGGNTAAVALYEKLGMREMEHLKRFYSNGDDAAVMVTPDLL